MKKLVLKKEAIRKLDDDTLERIVGGEKTGDTTAHFCHLNTDCVRIC